MLQRIMGWWCLKVRNNQTISIHSSPSFLLFSLWSHLPSPSALLYFCVPLFLPDVLCFFVPNLVSHYRLPFSPPPFFPSFFGIFFFKCFQFFLLPLVGFGLCIFLWLFYVFCISPRCRYLNYIIVLVFCVFFLPLLLILTCALTVLLGCQSNSIYTAVKRRCLSIAVTYIPRLYGSQDANQQAWENSHTRTRAHAHTLTLLAILLRWLRLTLSLLISSLNSFHLYIFFLHPSLLPPPLASS